MFLKKVSHHVVSKVYGFIPIQDFSKPWTDKELYEKYKKKITEYDIIWGGITAPCFFLCFYNILQWSINRFLSV